MKETKFEFEFEEISTNELSPLDLELKNRAIAAAREAYAPYSQFHVGVALMLNNGKIITGNNQENAAYPSGLCAERVALFYAGSMYPDIPVRTMAVVALSNGQQKARISPCGACRQVMLEVEKRGKTPIRILLCGSEKIQILSSANVLLPLAFDEDDLKP